MIEQNCLLDEIELEASDNISDNIKICIYDILVTEAYGPFSVINDYKDTNIQYDEEDSKALMGFLFRINYNDNHFGAYQQVCPVTMLKKSNSVYAVIGKNKPYDELKKDIIVETGIVTDPEILVRFSSKEKLTILLKDRLGKLE